MTVQLIVATHKQYGIPKDEIYFPICVGAEKESLRKIYQPDDEGENISDKNETYCELTAMYWAWKNLTGDHIGLCHYRRYFALKKGSGPLTKAELLPLLQTPKVYLTPKRVYPFMTIESHYVTSYRGYHQVHRMDIAALRQAVAEVAPGYSAALEETLSANRAHMQNMCLMPREWFFEYCGFLFPVIDKVVALRKDRADRRRYAGALGEFMMDVWLKVKGYPLEELAIYETEKQSLLKRFVFRMRCRLGCNAGKGNNQ